MAINIQLPAMNLTLGHACSLKKVDDCVNFVLGILLNQHLPFSSPTKTQSTASTTKTLTWLILPPACNFQSWHRNCFHTQVMLIKLHQYFTNWATYVAIQSPWLHKFFRNLVQHHQKAMIRPLWSWITKSVKNFLFFQQT